MSRAKSLLAAQDFTVQASITNVLENTRLITEEARRSALASPMLDVCHTLYTETAALGHGQSDMAAIIRAIESRTEAAVSAVVSEGGAVTPSYHRPGSSAGSAPRTTPTRRQNHDPGPPSQSRPRAPTGC